jgi:hypothetical protein
MFLRRFAMKRLHSYPLIALILVIGCGEYDATEVEIRLQNLSPRQPIAFKFPNQCYSVVYPGNVSGYMRTLALEQCVLIAFTDIDDPLEFGLASSNEEYYRCLAEPYRTVVKDTTFDTRARVKKDPFGPEDLPRFHIVAEEINDLGGLQKQSDSAGITDAQGIKTIQFRIERRP